MNQEIKPDTGMYNQLEADQVPYQVPEQMPDQMPSLTQPNQKLIFWLKFEGIVNYIGFGFIILMSLLSIISIIGIFSSLPFLVIGGVYSFYRARKHYQIANSFKTLSPLANSNPEINNILNNFRDVYKWSGIVNIITLVGLILSFVAIVGVTALFYNGFSEGGGYNGYNGFNNKSNSSICEKAPYSVECSNTTKSEKSEKSSTSSSTFDYDKMR